MLILSPLEQFQILSLITIKLFGFDFSITNALLVNVLAFLCFSGTIYLFSSNQNCFNKSSFFFIPNPWQIIFESVYEVVSQWLLAHVSTSSRKYFPFLKKTNHSSNIGCVWSPKAIKNIALCSMSQPMTSDQYLALCISMEEKHGQEMDAFIYCPPYPGNLTLVEMLAWVNAWQVRADNYSSTVGDQTNTYVEDPTSLFEQSIGLTDPGQVVAAYRIYRTFAPCANFMWAFSECMLLAKYMKFRQPNLVNLTQEEYWGIYRPLTRNNPSEIPLRDHFTESELIDFFPWANYADYKTEFHNSEIFPRIEGYLERSCYESSQGRRLLRNRLVKVVEEQQNPCPTLRGMSPETFNYEVMSSSTRADINLFPQILGEDSIC